MKPAMYPVTLVAFAIATLVLQGDIHAGRKDTGNVVYIYNKTSNGGVAWGRMGSTRNSSESNAYIECHISGDQNSLYGWCWAQTAAGEFLSCNAISSSYFNAQNMLEVIKTVDDRSQVWFGVTNGNCTFIQVGKSSAFELPAP
jgi:hypothetical protein